MIDIIIPAYNCKETLFKTLSSLETQTDTNFNVIIVDDCSTEDLLPIINEKQSRLNIKYIRKLKNKPKKVNGAFRSVKTIKKSKNRRIKKK